MELKDFIDMEEKMSEIKRFLFMKCIDYCIAANYEVPKYETLANEYRTYELDQKHGLIIVSFVDESCREDDRHYDVVLPLDVVFDTDFIEKLKIQFEETRKKLEADRQILKEREFKKQEAFNMQILVGILHKYPEASQKVIEENESK